MERKPVEKPDISERGAGGASLDRRLFVQLLAFTGCDDVKSCVDALSATGLECVLYEEVNDPRGIAVLTMAEDPAVFVTELRAALRAEPFASLTPKPEFAMLGRTYALGYEPDLEEVLFKRPRRTAMNQDWPWAVWYPLRRSGQFARLAPEEQRAILKEHGEIGFGFGAGDFAHDIRLACYGLDKNDNDFVIGLMGKALHPLSALVQAMRRTQQTAMYLEKLGPFFVGRKVWGKGG